MALTIDKLLDADNIADLLPEKKLKEIGKQVYNGYDLDLKSRQKWKDTVDRVLRLVRQEMAPKSHQVRENPANTCFPLVAKAAVEFAAQAYGELVQNKNLVHLAIHGDVIDERESERRAKDTAGYLAYQLLDESPDWEDDLDSLLQQMYICGTMFKKTYYDHVAQCSKSITCKYDEVVVNHDTVKSLDTARRITHQLYHYKNDIESRMRMGIFKKLDIKKLISAASGMDEIDAYVDVGDDDPPIAFLEQQCYLDLDDDGYAEPYVVTIQKESQIVVRIYPRYTSLDVDSSPKGESDEQIINSITGTQPFTEFTCLKNPDGGFYGIGLGMFLLPVNESINAILNTLIDTGVIAASPGGFLGGLGLRFKGGTIRPKQNEWKVIPNMTGEDLAKSFFPYPVKEPSPVLFSLLDLMINSGKDLASLNDVLQGKERVQNVSPTVLLATMERGLKVFSAIQKRTFRSQKQEYKKLFKLNQLYLSKEKYSKFLNHAADPQMDFDLSDMDLTPVADPSMSSTAQRLTQAQAIMAVPGVNEQVQRKHYFRALQLTESQIEELEAEPEQPKLDPGAIELQVKMKELEQKFQDAQNNHLIEVERVKIQAQDAQSREMEAMKRVEYMDAQIQSLIAKTAIAGASAVADNNRDNEIIDQKEREAILDSMTKLKLGEMQNERGNGNT